MIFECHICVTLSVTGGAPRLLYEHVYSRNPHECKQLSHPWSMIFQHQFHCSFYWLIALFVCVHVTCDALSARISVDDVPVIIRSLPNRVQALTSTNKYSVFWDVPGSETRLDDRWCLLISFYVISLIVLSLIIR